MTAKSKSSRGEKIVCTNKKARRDYQIDDVIEAGLVLRGNEVKSLRESRANLTDAYARIKGTEVWLSGLHISPYSHAPLDGQEPDREIKLLLHAREIKKLGIKILERGFSLIPLRVYFLKGRAKVELGLGKGKKFYDKRQDIKKRDAQRDIDRAMKGG